MHNANITRRVSHVLLLAGLGLTTAFTTIPGEPEPTYLHKIIAGGSRTTLEYNTDKTVNKLVQVYKGESGEYQEVIVPVYENGRLVKTMSTDNTASAATDLNTSLEYAAGGQVQRISYYRDNAVYAYDSLAYGDGGHLVARYQFAKQPGKNAWENSGYQAFTWDGQGNIIRQDNFGKQPGYSKFVNVSSISYRYDDKLNPRQQQGLAWMLELQPAYLSAHNVIGETLVSNHSSRPVTSTCVYSYTGGKFPLKATYTTDADPGIVKMEFTRL
ncbi:hypothetical protein CLV59_104330 [Chitinophaga dinghuensis]|uniref:YD repeat-containing protein n=1 Tax=Chitinophaga dinghuensis TaxID=1539050 RepID=A0A327W1I1_9BACT|nr:hypothetical protein [Chitinophaga dinghuensis]RAJ82105.1 hypothetical protein CLV59_104330 [Chitinophaga dinghuensis]